MKISIAAIVMLCAGIAFPFTTIAAITGPYADHCNGFIRVEPWSGGKPLPREVIHFQERCMQSNGAIYPGGNPGQQIATFICECPKYNGPGGACYNPNTRTCSPPELLAPLNFNRHWTSDGLPGNFQVTEQLVGFPQVTRLTDVLGGEMGLSWTVNAIENGKYKLSTSKRLKGSGILSVRSGVVGIEVDLILRGGSCQFLTNAPGHYYEGQHMLMIPVKKESLRSTDALETKAFAWSEIMNIFQDPDLYVFIDCASTEAPALFDVSLFLLVWTQTFTSPTVEPRIDAYITSFGIEPSLENPESGDKTRVFKLMTLPSVGVATP